MKVFILPINGKDFYTNSSDDIINELLPALENANEGESVSIQIIEMTTDEYNNLPEFE